MKELILFSVYYNEIHQLRCGFMYRTLLGDGGTAEVGPHLPGAHLFASAAEGRGLVGQKV